MPWKGVNLTNIKWAHWGYDMMHSLVFGVKCEVEVSKVTIMHDVAWDMYDGFMGMFVHVCPSIVHHLKV